MTIQSLVAASAISLWFSVAVESVLGQGSSRLTKLPAGTTVVDEKANQWNRLLLLATPSFQSGDFDQIPTPIRSSVVKFSLTLMATVSRSEGADYQLTDVGVGYSTPVKGRHVIVTASDAGRVGANLGFFDRQVLSRNATQLDTPRIVVRTSTLLIFDAPAIMSRATGHAQETMRHLAWVDPDSGETSMAVWLLIGHNESGGGMKSLTVQLDPMQLLVNGTRENRNIHVDGSTFFLGIPGEQSFALERIPPGRAVAWTSRLLELAGKLSYDQESLHALTAALNDAIAASNR